MPKLKLPPYILRSLVFNLLFYLTTALACIILLPTLMLPRRVFLGVVYGFVYTTAFLEKYILGLNYEIRGLENLPADGRYLIAAKHQSAYETTKLHILFGDPAIVLKRELLNIPLWGWYLRKSDVIAIDRSTPKMAIQSIQDGARRMMIQQRPIIIFPQGTRVSVNASTQTHPYKIGIVRMQEATNLPIIPMALNTGYFWPRNSFFKKPGLVVFEFIKPIMPGGDPSQTLQNIQSVLERKSNDLLAEARNAENQNHQISLTTLLWCLFLIFLFLWPIYWLVAAKLVKDQTNQMIADIRAESDFKGSKIQDVVTSGFPFQLKLTSGLQKILYQSQVIEITNIEAKTWPIPGLPITIKTGPIKIQMNGWNAPIIYDDFWAKLRQSGEKIQIYGARMRQNDFEGSLAGDINMREPYPAFDLTLNFRNHETLMQTLVQSGALQDKDATLANVTLQSMKDKDGVTLKITSHDRNVYLGPLRVYQFPDITQTPAILEDGNTSSRATRRLKPALDQ